MRIEIDRATWRRGVINESLVGKSFLLDPENASRCCVGFACRAAGLPDQALRGRAAVCDLGAEWSDPRDDFRPRGLTGKAAEGNRNEAVWLGNAYCLNDDVELPEAEREEKLAALFARHGHELVFSGRTPGR